MLLRSVGRKLVFRVQTRYASEALSCRSGSLRVWRAGRRQGGDILAARPARSNTGVFFDIIRRGAGGRVFCRLPQCFSGGIQTISRLVRLTAGVERSCRYPFACFSRSWVAIALWHGCQLGSVVVEYLAAASYLCRCRFAMKQVDLLRFDNRSIRLVFSLLSHPALQATFARQYNAI